MSQRQHGEPAYVLTVSNFVNRLFLRAIQLPILIESVLFKEESDFVTGG